jgi:hypothetical protein
MTRFATPFDRALAEAGPPAIFLRDREGGWRFDAQWTRDAWGRVSEPARCDGVFHVARDRASGFHLVVLATGDLLGGHPRLDVVAVASEADADARLAGLGAVPVGPWSP